MNAKQTDYTFSDINLVCSIENVFIKQYIEAWCNGNTTDFGSVILGSNPSASSKIRLQIGSNSRPSATIKEGKSP